jgi:hypothetical protein
VRAYPVALLPTKRGLNIKKSALREARARDPATLNCFKLSDLDTQIRSIFPCSTRL